MFKKIVEQKEVSQQFDKPILKNQIIYAALFRRSHHMYHMGANG